MGTSSTRSRGHEGRKIGSCRGAGRGAREGGRDDDRDVEGEQRKVKVVGGNSDGEDDGGETSGHYGQRAGVLIVEEEGVRVVQRPRSRWRRRRRRRRRLSGESEVQGVYTIYTHGF